MLTSVSQSVKMQIEHTALFKVLFLLICGKHCGNLIMTWPYYNLLFINNCLN